MHKCLFPVHTTADSRSSGRTRTRYGTGESGAADKKTDDGAGHDDDCVPTFERAYQLLPYDQREPWPNSPRHGVCAG